MLVDKLVEPIAGGVSHRMKRKSFFITGYLEMRPAGCYSMIRAVKRDMPAADKGMARPDPCT
jgi:hypothetical protein